MFPGINSGHSYHNVNENSDSIGMSNGRTVVGGPSGTDMKLDVEFSLGSMIAPTGSGDENLFVTSRDYLTGESIGTSFPFTNKRLGNARRNTVEFA